MCQVCVSVCVCVCEREKVCEPGFVYAWLTVAQAFTAVFVLVQERGPVTGVPLHIEFD